MLTLDIANAVLLDPGRVIRPAVTTWTRVEPLPLSTDLQPGLAAPIADPLWLLARQWQFLEFAGEDAGTPIEVRIDGDSAPLARVLAGIPDKQAATRATDYDNSAMPLEVVVEREPVWATHPRLAAEAGLQLQRMLTAAKLTSLYKSFVAAYPLEPPADGSAGADRDGVEWLALAGGRALDGRLLAATLRLLRNPDGSLSDLPPQPAIATKSRQTALSVLQDWLAWYGELLVDPVSADAWNAQRQEYAFTLSAATPDGELSLAADEYADRHLDWYALRGSATGLDAAASVATPLAPRPVLPVPAQYAGKPADRYWEFEDQTINFGALTAGPTDLSRLLLAEFGLIYGNDWFVIPLRLPVGSVTRIAHCAVRDTFGVETLVTPSRNDDGTPWAMFELSERPAGLSSAGRRTPATRDWWLLAPTLAQTLEGDALERVALFRDEMANMAWAVEHRVQGASGMPYARYDEASIRAARSTADAAGVTGLVYRLATAVPEHWLPLVPVPAAGSNPALAPVTQYERRAMLRVDADGQRSRVQPKGLLLRTDPGVAVDAEPPLRIEDEEIGRAGIVVERNFQLARWVDGRTLVWLGRSKQYGLGEGSSGLRFDVLSGT